MIYIATVYYGEKDGFPPPLITRHVMRKDAENEEDFKRRCQEGCIYPVSFGPISKKKEEG